MAFEPGSKSSPDHTSAGTPILDSSLQMRNTIAVIHKPLVRGLFVRVAPVDDDRGQGPRHMQLTLKIFRNTCFLSTNHRHGRESK